VNAVPKKKLSCEEIKYFIKDEKKAVAEYKALGLTKLANDEAKHQRFFEKQLKKRCR
jgi:hypothetical protein